MALICPSCRRAVGGASIDRASNRALCVPCGEIIFLPKTAALETSLEPIAPQHALMGPTAAFRPSTLALAERTEGETWTLAVGRRRSPVRPLVFLGGGWSLFVFAILLAAQPQGALGHLYWLAVYLIGLVMLPITYFSARQIANRARVRMDGSRIEVAEHPIPEARVRAELNDVSHFEPASPGFVDLRFDEAHAVRLPIRLGSFDEAAHVAYLLNRTLDERRPTDAASATGEE
jgi:hypothetical protein